MLRRQKHVLSQSATPFACTLKDCQEQWSILGLVGVIFALLTFCFVAIPAVLDCIVDRWIRKARWMISMSERSARTLVASYPESMRIKAPTPKVKLRSLTAA